MEERDLTAVMCDDVINKHLLGIALPLHFTIQSAKMETDRCALPSRFYETTLLY